MGISETGIAVTPHALLLLFLTLFVTTKRLRWMHWQACHLWNPTFQVLRQE
jgi:hypothetical protein